MNLLAGTTPALIRLRIMLDEENKLDIRVATEANILDLTIREPDGVVVDVDPANITVVEPGKVEVLHDLTKAGVHEVVLRVDVGGQILPTSAYRFRVDPSHYGT